MTDEKSKTIIRHLKGIVAALEKEEEEKVKFHCQGDCNKETDHKVKVIEVQVGQPPIEVYQCVKCGSQIDRLLADGRIKGLF